MTTNTVGGAYACDSFNNGRYKTGVVAPCNTSRDSAEKGKRKRHHKEGWTVANPEAPCITTTAYSTPHCTAPTPCTAAYAKEGQHRELSGRDAHGSEHFRAAHITHCTRNKHDSQHKHTLCFGGQISWGSGVIWHVHSTRLHTPQCESEPLNMWKVLIYANLR